MQKSFPAKTTNKVLCWRVSMAGYYLANKLDGPKSVSQQSGSEGLAPVSGLVLALVSALVSALISVRHIFPAIMLKAETFPSLRSGREPRHKVLEDVLRLLSKTVHLSGILEEKSFISPWSTFISSNFFSFVANLLSHLERKLSRQPLRSNCVVRPEKKAFSFIPSYFIELSFFQLEILNYLQNLIPGII